MPRGGPNDPGTRCRMIKADGSRFELTAAKSKNADGYCYQHMGAQRRRTWGAIKRVRSGYHATDDSSLPSAGRGMTRMHNLCAQRQRAIDMKVSHIAPGGLRPSAMHEPREISKQTNNHSGPAIYVHYGADPGRTHPRTLATVARFPRPESAPAVASTIWSRRHPGANFTYGPLLHHHARDVMIGIYSYIQR